MKKQPRGVSIIILTHNNLRYTQECLEALDETTSGHQIVIVDNASTDGTPEFLQKLAEEKPHVRALFNTRNAGFAAGCNQGVAASKYGTICLLNNDTVPMEGWLDAMLEVLSGDVGIVGSKLMLPDTTLQHCGIEFQYNKEPVPHFWPYHRYLKEPEDLPEANVLEEVPGVTAACLLTTKKVWDRVDGMDEGYFVANFEDVDFNLAVRDKGFRVMYQPASRLTHYWGTTVNSKGDAPDSPGRYFEQNFARLYQKWFDKLRTGLHTVPGRTSAPPPVTRTTDGGLHVLFTLLNFRFLTGSELYVYELCRELRERGHRVTVISQTGGVVDARARQLGVEVYDVQSAPYRSLRPDILHVSQFQPAEIALKMFPSVPAVATVHSQYDIETPLVDDRIERYICIRPEIMEHIVSDHQIAPERCAVVYNPIDFTRFRPVEMEPHARRRTVFVGTIDPLRQNTILNLVERSTAEDFDLRIVGQRHADYLDNVDLPHVTVEAPVWDIERYIYDATETAGVLLGRTTIEGWACGKPGWIYEVDEAGEILGYELHQPPKDMSRFDSRLVADTMERIYREAISAKG
ncbi:MAG: glycosyltransferase [Coriobacteriia bacterium]